MARPLNTLTPRRKQRPQPLARWLHKSEFQDPRLPTSLSSSHLLHLLGNLDLVGINEGKMPHIMQVVAQCPLPSSPDELFP